MKKLYICALVVKLLVFTSVERVHAFSTAPFEEPGGGTFFTPGWGTTFEFVDEGTFFEPDGSGNLQQPTAYSQIRNFFQTSIMRLGARSGDDCWDSLTFADWEYCCDTLAGLNGGIAPEGQGCDSLDDWNTINDARAPIGNGLLFLLSIAALHFVIVYFRRKAVV